MTNLTYEMLYKACLAAAKKVDFRTMSWFGHWKKK